MNPQLILELIGYLGSLLVLISLLMTSVIRLRIINSIGALIYVGYGIAIGSYPTAVMNACLVLVNIWSLIKLRRDKAMFSVHPADLGESGLNHFLRHYEKDIGQYFPGFSIPREDSAVAYVVYADADPVGLLMGTREDSTIRVALDYAAPRYRDCSVGSFLYTHLKQQGICRLIAAPCQEKHEAYLLNMGFRREDGRFIKDL